jgi:hypothetical protein
MHSARTLRSFDRPLPFSGAEKHVPPRPTTHLAALANVLCTRGNPRPAIIMSPWSHLMRRCTSRCWIKTLLHRFNSCVPGLQSASTPAVTKLGRYVIVLYAPIEVHASPGDKLVAIPFTRVRISMNPVYFLLALGFIESLPMTVKCVCENFHPHFFPL